MAARELVFDIFAIDRASAVFDRVGLSAEGMGAKGAGAGAMMTKGLVAAGAIAVAFGVESVKMAGDFEAAVTRLHTSAGETKANLGLVSDGMLKMAGQVGFTAEELAKGMYVVESAGYHGAKGLDTLKAAAEGARTENADLGTVANAVTTIMRDFGDKAGSAAQVTSTLIAAVSVGKTNFQDLSESMHSVMPRASALGLSFAEVSADLASMTAHGISAQQAAQNMNDAIGHLAKPTLAMSKAMADFGIQSHDVSINLSKKGLAGTMQMLSDTIMQQMGPAGAQLKTVFNQSKLAADDAKKMFDSMSPSLRKVAQDYIDGKISMRDWTMGIKDLDAPSANLMKQWAVQENAAKGFSQTLKSGGDTAKTYAAALQAVTGDQASMTVALMLTGENAAFANENIKTVSGTVVDASGHVAGFADQQATLNGKLADAKGATSAFMVELGQKLIPTAEKAVDVFASLVGWMSKNTDTVILVGGALAFLATAIGVVTAAQWAWNVAMAANPVGLVIIAIAALAAGMIYLYNTNATAADSMNYGFMTLKQNVYLFAAGAVQAFSWLFNVSTIVFAGILDAAAAALGWIPGGVGDAVHAASDKFNKFRDDTNNTLGGIQKDLRINANTVEADYEINALNSRFHNMNWTAQITGNVNKLAGMDAAMAAAGVGHTATGTEHWRGGMTWLGENGPELVNLPAGSKVKDTNASKAMGGSNGGPMVHIENYNEAHQHPDDIAAAWMFKVRSA